MTFKKTAGLRTIVTALALVSCGGAMAVAGMHGLWGLLAGSGLVALWLSALMWWAVVRPRSAVRVPVADAPDAATHRLLLDAAPVPMVGIAGETGRALNRAARALFATDDRLLPMPVDLADPGVGHVQHAGRRWRIDRVDLGADRAIAALIDVDQEERTAEARAAADLIQVLGHELLNGLAPIASLADSGLAAIDRSAADSDLLREILTTLGRRAEGLQRFAEAYRALARLPEPTRRAVALGEMIGDLERLFAGRWPDVALAVEGDTAMSWPLDRDQITQALWAVLQNAAEAASEAGTDACVTLTIDIAHGSLRIEIGDSGSGVSPAQAAQIFRPFHTTKPTGTGIGLSLARQIAHAHGGTLTLEQERLTTFRLTVPSA